MAESHPIVNMPISMDLLEDIFLLPRNMSIVGMEIDEPRGTATFKVEVQSAEISGKFDMIIPQYSRCVCNCCKHAKLHGMEYRRDSAHVDTVTHEGREDNDR